MSTREFVDPRVYPDPPCRVPVQQPASSAEELVELTKLCADGRIYAVEEWIKQGKPCWARDYRIKPGKVVKNPLATAIKTNQRDLVSLFLCNGVPPDGGEELLLTEVVADRHWEILDELLAFGADLTSVSPFEIVDSYNVDLYDRYEAAGGDVTRGHALARSLGQHSSNRPGYGWVRKRKDDPRVAREIAIALVEAVKDGRERAVAMLRWAGADPHVLVTDIPNRYSVDDVDEEEEGWASAVFMAVTCDHAKILSMLKPDPSRDDFDDLWKYASSIEVVDCLAAIQPPKSWSVTILRNLERWASGYHGWESERCVKHIRQKYEAKLEVLEEDGLRSLRSSFRRARDSYSVGEVVKWLHRPQNCAPDVYAVIVRAKSVKKYLEGIERRRW